MSRRKGSKNRTPEEKEAYLKMLADKPKGKRGRPVGSKNKIVTVGTTELEVIPEKETVFEVEEKVNE
jgi:hypothetical protein